MIGMPANPPRRRRPRRDAYSLLELVAAVSIIGATLAPAIQLVRDALDLSVETDRRQLLASYAVSQLERRLADVADDFTTTAPIDHPLADDFAADGMADIRYTTVLSDAAIDGGISGLLMSISTTTYYDEDGDDLLDADELSCTFTTKIGQFATYEAL